MKKWNKMDGSYHYRINRYVSIMITDNSWRREGDAGFRSTMVVAFNSTSRGFIYIGKYKTIDSAKNKSLIRAANMCKLYGARLTAAWAALPWSKK